MSVLEPLRVAGPMVLAVLSAWAVDHLSLRRGFLPPGFANPVRRLAALLVLSAIFWIGLFAPLGFVGQEQEVDLAGMSSVRLFLLHFLLVVTLGIWYLLGFGTRGGLGNLTRQLGLYPNRPLVPELVLGGVIGVGAWVFVLGLVILVGVLVGLVGGFDELPKEPPPMVPWLAGLPLTVRLGVSLSAGVVEETFFRGFLQPRVGITLSTLMFVLAHLSYEEPFMLVGVAALSLIYAWTVRWRQNVWAAIVAHALFDAVQLLVVIPRLLELFR